MTHPTLTDPLLQRAVTALEEATRTLTDDDWAVVPVSRWSRAAVVEHLGKVYESTARLLDACVTDGTPKGATPTWKQRLGAWMLLDVGYFPTGAKAPSFTFPEGLSGPDALAYARRALHDFDRAAVRCTEVFQPDVRVATHPILGGFTVEQWRRFHWQHTRHHTRQIARRR